MHRIRLETTVMELVTKYFIARPSLPLHLKDPRGRPKAIYQRNIGNTFMAYMYHPDELDEVHSVIDRYLRCHGMERTADHSVPLLVSAHYGSTFGRKVVTDKVAAMIRDNELVLSSPRKYARNWYNDLFEDPFPGVTKYLEIVTRYERGYTRVHKFPENSRVDLAIRRS